jgi:hypothetical protein
MRPNATARCHPDQPRYIDGEGERCDRHRLAEGGAGCQLCRTKQIGLSQRRRTKQKDLTQPRRTKQMGLTGLGEAWPERVDGVEHRAVLSVPSGCPKCRSQLLVVDGRRVACPGYLAGCGWDAFLVSPPRQASGAAVAGARA